MRWNESHRVSHLPPILLCCRSPPPSYRPLSSRSLSLPLSLPVAPYEALFYSESPSLSHSPLFSPIYRSTFRLLSLLSQPSFSFSPTRTRRDEEPRALYTRAHVLTYIRLQGFCSWRPILSDNEDDPFSSGWKESRGGRRVADGRDTILPSCCGRDIFSLSRDNLETRVVLPGPESTEGKRLG